MGWLEILIAIIAFPLCLRSELLAIRAYPTADGPLLVSAVYCRAAALIRLRLYSGDIGLPGASGIESVRILRQGYPSIVSVMFTVYKDDGRIFQAICAGACGYVLKKPLPLS